MSGTPCDACDNDARSMAAKDDADVMSDVREFYERLGMNIKVDRVRRKMRQRELAMAVGVGAVTVCGWESGERHISVHDLLKVCRVLDKQVGDIVPGVSGGALLEIEVN